MTRLYLGIDPGTTTGWAVLDGVGNRIASNVIKLGKSTDRLGQRYLMLNRALEDITRLWGSPQTNRFDGIGYEDVIRHAAPTAAHLYGGFVAMLTSWAESYGIPYRGINVSTVKQAATGNGSASKLAMVQAANARWTTHILIAEKTVRRKGELVDSTEYTFPGCGDNIADALWIAEAVRRQMEQQS